MQPFPADWRTALVVVAHPDDAEYEMAAAVAKWTTAGKRVHYALASRGEAGIAGMPTEIAGPVREREQRESAAIVGVHDVQFWDFLDGSIYDTPELRAKIAEAIIAVEPEVVLAIYGGPEWEPGAPNQRDHIECATAVAGAFDALTDPPRWLFENGPQPTHGEPVEGYLDAAIEALAAHEATRPGHTGHRTGAPTDRGGRKSAARVRWPAHRGFHPATPHRQVSARITPKPGCPLLQPCAR